MATEKNKKRIVPSLDVTKSDFTIGFSVVDLVENKAWLVDFSWNVGFFRARNLKSRVSINKFSKQLVGPIHPKLFLLKDQPKISTSVENRTVVTSSCPEMTSSKNS